MLKEKLRSRLSRLGAGTLGAGGPGAGKGGHTRRRDWTCVPGAHGRRALGDRPRALVCTQSCVCPCTEPLPLSPSASHRRQVLAMTESSECGTAVALLGAPRPVGIALLSRVFLTLSSHFPPFRVNLVPDTKATTERPHASVTTPPASPRPSVATPPASPRPAALPLLTHTLGLSVATDAQDASQPARFMSLDKFSKIKTT